MYKTGNYIKVLVERKTKNVYYKNQLRDVEFCIYRNYAAFYGFPIFPLGKTYSAKISELDEYYEHGPFVKMPEELFEVCKQMNRLL